VMMAKPSGKLSDNLLLAVESVSAKERDVDSQVISVNRTGGTRKRREMLFLLVLSRGELC
jgi:hypothetical protein